MSKNPGFGDTQPHIVVIEDEVDFLESIQRSFRIAGIEHFTLQQDPQCALAFLENGAKVDVILMNGLMAGMPGTEMLKHITAFRPDTPCIVMTGSIEKNDISAHYENGAAAVLMKPFSHDRLIEVILQHTMTGAGHSSDRHMNMQRPAILLVDDEESIRTTYRMKLERSGYRVVAAENGREAFDLFYADPDGFDLVITDIIMPGMNGDQLLLEVLRIRPDMPFIITSGAYGGTSRTVLAAAVKADAFLEKPYRLDRLTDAVERKLTAGDSMQEVYEGVVHS